MSTEPGIPATANLADRFAALVAFQKRLHAAGFAVPGWPKELGGRDLSPVDVACVAGVLGARGAPELINFVGIDVLGPALLEYGRPDDLRTWMPLMASADEIWCQLFSEPDAGSDLTSLKTKAIQTANGDWKVVGQKVWSTWAQFATWGVLLARTGTQESRHRGISAFVVEMSSPGITIAPLQTMTGSAEFAEVFFDDVILPKSALLGPSDGGWSVAQMILNAERGSYAVRRAAVIGAALQRSIEVAKRRVTTLRERQYLVQAYADFRLLEFQVAHIVDDLGNGRDLSLRAPVIKCLMTQAEQSVFTAQHALAGMRGVAWMGDEDTSVVEDYLYSSAASIYGGTAQIQRNIIAERRLGLPRS
jgi:alkylation response protein AidB-like acyl-CoA dehydrogenase